jgi:hypothetical protein
VCRYLKNEKERMDAAREMKEFRAAKVLAEDKARRKSEAASIIEHRQLEKARDAITAKEFLKVTYLNTGVDVIFCPMLEVVDGPGTKRQLEQW